MIVVYNAAIRANRDINAGFLEVFITRCCNFNDRGSLSTTNALLLTGDTNRAAADTDFDKVCTCFGEEAEPFTVNDIACAYLYGVTVVYANP